MEDRRSSRLTENRPPVAPVPDFNSFPADKWIAVEAPIGRILSRVRPTEDSEDTRNDVVRYMRQLIENTVGGVELLQYGSVPLKTYLPEGDIDLTAVSILEGERNLPREVYNALLAQEQNGNDEYELKDVRFIDAEVKLVKCVVNDIIMDISFNQISGLCALCFLEQVDRLIGKNHLFKRSIILIKSWCYYESHILGSIYGLISTYALETLILYIFCMYNASLASPLMVLYRFLEYYSKFNWDKFGISIDGPVNLSLLPDIVVEVPINHALLGGDYLRNQINLYTVPCKSRAGYRTPFTRKVINIIDPLKTNNNLGRSVFIGNFFRITFAFGFGARKLAEILKLPTEKIQEGIKNFFGNTLRMNESKFSLEPRLTFDDEDDFQSESLNADLESDDLNLADLSGDYFGNLRSLLLGQRIHGLPYSPVHEHHRLAVESNPNLTVHRTGAFIPPAGPPTRASGRGRVSPLPNREPNWAHGSTYEVGSSSSGASSSGPEPQSPQGEGQSSAPSSQVHTHGTHERRLEFGSFGRVSVTSLEPRPDCSLDVGTPSESVPTMSLPLMDDSEFPPL